ncbi:protein GVQW3-like [Aphis craccivora]|uniref:Protein GVQW3-like n=1 Tax=Aphis craccivora TaxID=307492 RepID=A0A6G0XKR5_APHCR|nr:protein GVQW3-like [Aphis craccivora]
MVAKLRKIIRSDRRMTKRELSSECNISFGSCQTILTEDLGMRRVCAKMVPKLLSQDQKNHRIEVCQSLKERTQNDPGFIKNVITGDETWVYGYDIETKRQSSQWKSVTSPRPKKARQVRSNVKTMLITFFDIKGLIYYEFVPTGQTVNQTYYKEVLIKLREKIPDKQIPVVPHPPYSPYLAPCDFFLFPKIKTDLKGQGFDDIKTIKKNAVDQLKQLKVEDFQHCFKKWQERWDKCITSGGDYFEGD